MSERTAHICFLSKLQAKIIIVFCLFHVLPNFSTLHAQIKATKKTVTISDTNKIVEIIHAKHFRQIWFNDTSEIQTLSGNAAIRQGSTLLQGDSIVIHRRRGLIEVFGHVYVNDGDTVKAYSGYLRYESRQKMAYFKKNVRLTDGKSTVFTNDLEYDVTTGMAKYKNFGKVVTGKTILTSKTGTYYADTKDIFFEGDVRMKDPKYTMTAERLRYNTFYKNVYFTSPTHIVTKKGTIDTENGYYNMVTGEAVFTDRTIFRDSTQSIVGDRIAIDEKNDVIQIEKNGKFIDTKEQVIVIGDQLLIDRKNQTFLATRKPVMILYDKGDSTYIAADTLFSGKRLASSEEKADKPSINDSIQYFLGYRNVRIFNDSIQAVSDSMHYSTSDSTYKLAGHPICWNGSTQISGDTMHMYMKNNSPDYVKVFNHAMVIHESKAMYYDQLAGKTLEGFFQRGELEHVLAKSSPAESIFYPQNSDSSYMGMNYNQAQWIEFFYEQKEVKTIKYSTDVQGELYPLGQIPQGKDKLKDYNWQPDKRPKTKYSIFD